LTEIMYFK